MLVSLLRRLTTKKSVGYLRLRGELGIMDHGIIYGFSEDVSSDLETARNQVAVAICPTLISLLLLCAGPKKLSSTVHPSSSAKTAAASLMSSRPPCLKGSRVPLNEP